MVAGQLHLGEHNPAVEILPRVVSGEVFGTRIVQIVVDVPDAVALAEVTVAPSRRAGPTA